MKAPARLTLSRWLLAGLSALCGACPPELGKPGPFIVNQRDFALDFVVRELRLPCALLDVEQSGKLTTGDFLSPQGLRFAGRDIFPLADLEYGRCSVAVHWVTVGDFDGMVFLRFPSPAGAHDDEITQTLLDLSLLVEGDRTNLFVTVGKELHVLPPPREGPPTLTLPPELEPASDGGMHDAGTDDAGAELAPDASVRDGG
jgi:hypothetical protein